MKPFLIDTHAHLDLFDNAEVPDLISRAAASGVGRIVSVGIGLDSSKHAIEIAASYPGVLATVGVHPHEAGELNQELVGNLKKLAQNPLVVAIGETGLDYYRMRAPKDSQIQAFKRQTELAAELDLPIIIHCRDAFNDTLHVLEEMRPSKAILHCFSGDQAQASAFLELNCYISFTGVITFKNTATLQEVVAQVPIDKLLIETDAPYLAPQNYRGQRNEPSYVVDTAKKIADIKRLSVEQVIKETAANADKLFGGFFAQESLFSKS